MDLWNSVCSHCSRSPYEARKAPNEVEFVFDVPSMWIGALMTIMKEGGHTSQSGSLKDYWNRHLPTVTSQPFPGLFDRCPTGPLGGLRLFRGIFETRQDIHCHVDILALTKDQVQQIRVSFPDSEAALSSYGLLSPPGLMSGES